MNKNTGGPAFPTVDENHYSAGGEGMTMRDYFAAKALQGLLSGRNHAAEVNVRLAYEYADAMLKEREK